MKKVLIVAASSLELEDLTNFLSVNGIKKGFFDFEYKGIFVSTLVTGIGSVKMALGISMLPNIKEFDLLINIGIAGVYGQLPLGQVVEVTSDEFADLGVEDAEGNFSSVFKIGLEEENTYPFKNGAIVNENNKFSTQLPKAKARTYNTVSGATSTMNKRYFTNEEIIETMEGAGFAYAAHCLQISYLHIRAISNYIEPRDKAKWEMKLAIKNLTESIVKFLDDFPLKSNI